MNSRIFNSFNNISIANINKAITVSTSVISSNIKAPIFGSSAATYVSTTDNLPVNSGYTLKKSASEDDQFISINLLFTFYLSVAQTTVHPSSNSYLTFGTGSASYSGLSSSVPPYPKIMLGSRDNSWQRVWDINNSNYYRIRHEGTATTSGSPGTPNIVYELTLVNPSYYGNGKQYIEVLFGTLSSTTITGTPFLIADASTNLLTNSLTLAQNTSYVFEGNSAGTSWTIYSGSLNLPPY